MKSGQTLVILLVFLAVAITVTSTASVLSIVNALSGSRLEQSQSAYDVAESGIENALIRLLRDPDYSGEILTVGEGSSTITVTGSNPYVITSTGSLGNFIRRIQATALFTSGIMSVTSWKEISH